MMLRFDDMYVQRNLDRVFLYQSRGIWTFRILLSTWNSSWPPDYVDCQGIITVLLFAKCGRIEQHPRCPDKVSESYLLSVRTHYSHTPTLLFLSDWCSIFRSNTASLTISITTYFDPLLVYSSWVSIPFTYPVFKSAEISCTSKA